MSYELFQAEARGILAPQKTSDSKLTTHDSQLKTQNSKLHNSECYFRNEMRTVFENASPTLSVVAPGTSATAMWTMRRS